MSENLMISLIDNVDTNYLQNTFTKISTFQAVIQKSLKEGQDYGTIPGTSKPTLLKPGGEKICMMMGLVPEYEFLKVDEDFDKGFFNYNIKCKLYKNEYKVSEGVGSCNSKETKYRYTWVPENEVPNYIDKESLKSSERYGRTQYRVENPEVFSLANTILKMGKKRAFIDAVLQVASLSEIFTQDLEDMQDLLQQEQVSTMNENDADKIKITFGKYKGSTLGEIYKSDESYIKWLAEKAKDEVVRKAALMVLNPPAPEANNVIKAAKEALEKHHPEDAQSRAVDMETGEIYTDGDDSDLPWNMDDEDIPF